MARSLIGGLIAARLDARADRRRRSRCAAQLDALRAQYGVRVTSDNADAARDADVVVLAVKPQEMRDVVDGIQPQIAATRPLLISVAAGIRASDIQRWAGGVAGRALHAQSPGPAGLRHDRAVRDATMSSTERRALAEQILGAVGATLWLEREAAHGHGHCDLRQRPRLLLPADRNARSRPASRSGCRRRSAASSRSRPRMARASWRTRPASRPRPARAGDVARAARPRRRCRHARRRAMSVISSPQPSRPRRAGAAELADEFGADNQRQLWTLAPA